MRVRKLLPLAVVVLLTACASASGGDGTARRGNSNLITSAELEAVAQLSALEAIQRLRPQWLRGRAGSPDPVVFLDGSQMGDLRVLDTVSASGVQEMRFLNSSDATTRYGTGFGGGAIQVRTRG